MKTPVEKERELLKCVIALWEADRTNCIVHMPLKEYVAWRREVEPQIYAMLRVSSWLKERE